MATSMFHIIVLILHVLGAGVVLGVVFFSVIAVIKPAVVAEQLDRLHFVGRFGMWASGWQFVTGVILYLQEPDELQENKIFWVKLGLYVVEGLFASIVLNRQLKKLQTGDQATIAPGKLTGVLIVHALLIGAIIVLGVLIVEQ